MGRPKQLMEVDGETLIRRAALAAIHSVCNSVVVVLGAEAEAIGQSLAGLPIEIVENPAWQLGMGTSIHAGVEAAESHDADGLLLMLGDQPLVTSAVLNKLVLTNRATNQPIVASQYAGTVGVPVFFARDFFPHLKALKPSEGCKRLILSHLDQAVRLDCPEAEADIDTPADFARLRPYL